MFWALSPMENFVYWGGQRGLTREEAKKRGEDLLKTFDLLDKKHTSITMLSRGMQQIVGICCAMIAKPKLLILDEPTLGLDINATQTMIKSLRVLSKSGVGILITTHQLDFAQEVANKILLIKQGKLVFSDNVKDSLERLNKRTVFEVSFSRTLTAKETEKLLTHCEDLEETNKVYRISNGEKTKLSEMLKILSELPVVKVKNVTRGLDEIFKYYVRRKE